MVAELGLISMTQLQNFVQSQENQNQQHQHNIAAGSWMWYSKVQPQEHDDDSWEVRAFAEDTGNAMGTTWPPRSYTCTFCQREFRSAQALGGHMNVHRRDRARLLQTVTRGPNSSSTATNSPSTLLIPTQEFARNGGMCLLYQLHNPNGVSTSSPSMNAWSISPHPSLNLIAAAPTSINIPVPPTALNSPLPSTMSSPNLNRVKNYISSSNCKETPIEELDLELRLGHRRPTPTTS